MILLKYMYMKSEAIQGTILHTLGAALTVINITLNAFIHETMECNLNPFYNRNAHEIIKLTYF